MLSIPTQTPLDKDSRQDRNYLRTYLYTFTQGFTVEQKRSPYLPRHRQTRIHGIKGNYLRTYLDTFTQRFTVEQKRSPYLPRHRQTRIHGRTEMLSIPTQTPLDKDSRQNRNSLHTYLDTVRQGFTVGQELSPYLPRHRQIRIHDRTGTLSIPTQTPLNKDSRQDRNYLRTYLDTVR